MKLKYYLRGLGIGILVTAGIMTYTYSGTGQTMTDAEVRARAEELGMKESVVLSELSGVAETESETGKMTATETAAEIVAEAEPETAAVTETVSETEAVPETESAPETKAASEMESVPETKAVPEMESVLETKSVPAEDKTVAININRGDGSETVSRRLAEAGLVESAVSYNSYLCQNNYDKKLHVGVHQIPAGATEAEIAKILVSR